MKSWLIGKDSDAGRDWGPEEKGTTEDEMDGWHHWLDGRESEWTPGVGGGQGGLECCNSWGHKESDTTERLIWSDLSVLFIGSQRVRHAWATEKKFLLISDIECFFIYLLSTCISPLRNIYSDLLPIFKLELNDLFLFASNCISLLSILDIHPLSDELFANIFSHFVDLLFFFDYFFCYAEYF